MSTSSGSEHYRPLRSFTGSSIQQDDSMASSTDYHSLSGAPPPASYHSHESVRNSITTTDDDLEVARQKLLLAQAEDEEPEVSSIAPLLTDSDSSPLLYQGEGLNGGSHRIVAIEAPLSDSVSRASRYGSVSSNVPNGHSNVTKQKRYRLPLLILLGFDWGMVVFLSIICFVLKGVYNKDKSKPDYFDLDINEGFFDLVIIATFRTVCNILVYIVLGWVTRIVMAFTTVTSACYVPVKTFFLLSYDKNTSEAMYLVALILLVFVCFVIPWFVAFFFEFKYLPAEKARLDIPTWWAIKPWIWPNAYVRQNQATLPPPEPPTTMPIMSAPHRRTTSVLSLDFRTPMGSSRASPVMVERPQDNNLAPISEEPTFFSEAAVANADRNLSPQDEQIYQASMEALDGLLEMTRNNEGWVLDKTMNNLKCYTKQIKGRKVIKLDGVVEVPAQRLWSILYPGDHTYEWNQSCLINETVHRVDQLTDLVYTVSAAMGPVSSRDFVSARRIAFRDGTYYSCSKSIVTNLKPEQSGKVRGDVGPNGYVVRPISENRCQFIWIYNSNLKGWLPQTVVDQTVSTALLGAYQQLLVYVRQETRNNQA